MSNTPKNRTRPPSAPEANGADTVKLEKIMDTLPVE